MPRPRERLPELDALRGIAALMVVFFHTLLTLQLTDTGAYRVLNALPSHPMFAGRLAVIFFFVLSGAVLTRGLMASNARPGAFVAFACRRVIRLCVPTAAVLLLSAGLYVLCWNGPWPGSDFYGGWKVPPTAAGFTRQALLIGADGDFWLDPVLWSLVHELRLSILLPLLVALPMLRGLQGSLTTLLLGAIVFGFSVSGHTAIEDTIQLGPTWLETFRATGYFALPFLTGTALVLGQWQRWEPGKEQRRLALTAALLLLCSDNDLAAVVASVLLILLSRHPGWYRDFLLLPPLLLLGRISFSLYLVHMPVQLAVQHGLHTALSEAWMEPLTIAISLLAAWVVHYVAERPALLLSRRIKPTQPANAIHTIPIQRQI